MEDKTMRILNEFLLSEGTTWADLTNTQRKLFEKVMTEICRRVPFLEQADQMRKENAINQSSIARALGVERKTVGSNNKLVAKLIDKYSTNEQKATFQARGMQHFKKILPLQRHNLMLWYLM